MHLHVFSVVLVALLCGLNGCSCQEQNPIQPTQQEDRSDEQSSNVSADTALSHPPATADPANRSLGRPDIASGSAERSGSARGVDGERGDPGIAASGSSVPESRSRPPLASEVSGSGLLSEAGPGDIEIVYPAEPAAVDLDINLIDAMRLPATDSRRTLVGVWTQSAGPATADFASGGYSQSTLVFRTDGILEIVRFYGSASEIRLDAVLDYNITATGQVVIGSKREFTQGASMSFVPGSWGPAGRPQFPMTLKYSVEGETLLLNDKRYRPRTSGR
jgi:hypothetical protein